MAQTLPRHRTVGAHQAGTLEGDETPEAAVRRELLEETGLQVSEPLALFTHILLYRGPDGVVYSVEEGSKSKVAGIIIREVSIFYGATTAQEEDLVLGEGDALAFVEAQSALELDLAISTSFVLPKFLESLEYEQLVGKASDMHSEVEYALLKEMWYIDGRADALKYAWDCKGDLAQLRLEVNEVEERIHHPSDSMKGPMSTGASPRIYQDGYLKGLEDAIEVITQAVSEAERETSVAS